MNIEINQKEIHIDMTNSVKKVVGGIGAYAMYKFTADAFDLAAALGERPKIVRTALRIGGRIVGATLGSEINALVKDKIGDGENVRKLKSTVEQTADRIKSTVTEETEVGNG